MENSLLNNSLTLQEIFNTSLSRTHRWVSSDDWSPLEWAGAMCGETGETAGAVLAYLAKLTHVSGETSNTAKKLKRMLDGVASINEGDRHLTDISKAKKQVAKECCDVVLYSLLLAASVGCTADEFIETLREVFNSKSVEYGFPEML